VVDFLMLQKRTQNVRLDVWSRPHHVEIDSATNGLDRQQQKQQRVMVQAVTNEVVPQPHAPLSSYQLLNYYYYIRSTVFFPGQPG